MSVRKKQLVFYKDKKKEYRWRTIASNGRITATSGGDGYKNFKDCVDGFVTHFTIDWRTGDGLLEFKREMSSYDYKLINETGETL
jgi:uncharacterized protein YegP (UPF0339 family)